MIKLITPKRDLYMDRDNSNPEGLFGKKGKFYEVKGYGYTGEDIMFIDERGVEHSYGVDFVDTDFWTIDLSETFMFTAAWDRPIDYTWWNHKMTVEGDNETYDWGKDGLPELAIEAILDGSWTITRFSNQTPPPEEIRHPYENWKKDIGIAKFQRCIGKVNLFRVQVEGIKGLLDTGNELFYYSVHGLENSSYISCKVVRYGDNHSWKFPRPNKDTPEISKLAEDVHKPITDWLVNELVNNYVSTIGQECEQMDKILASFKVPEDKEDPFNPEYQFKSEGQIVTDNIAKQEYFSRRMELAYMNTFKSSGNHGEEVSDGEGNTWTDKHYNFTYTLTPEDVEVGKIKIDPYFVAYQWKLGEKDNSGALWHCFKNIARFGEKNSVEREIKALHAQVKRLAELNSVRL